MVLHGRIRLDRTDDFKKFADQYWTGFNFFGSGLDSEGKFPSLLSENKSGHVLW